MIKHIVFWKLKSPAKQKNLFLIKEKLESLIGKIDGLLKIEVGIDFSETDNSYDLCLYSEFDSKLSLENYQRDPKHRAIIPFILETTEVKAMVDYEV